MYTRGDVVVVVVLGGILLCIVHRIVLVGGCVDVVDAAVVDGRARGAVSRGRVLRCLGGVSSSSV